MHKYRVRVMRDGALHYHCCGADLAIGNTPKQAFENYSVNALVASNIAPSIAPNTIIGMERVGPHYSAQEITLLTVKHVGRNGAKVTYL